MTIESNPKNIRARIEDGLGSWAGFVARHRVLVTLAMIVLTILLGSYVPQTELKMATEDFLFEDDPVRQRYDQFKRDFGQDQIASLAIEPPEVFDIEFLTKLRALHKDLEAEVPYLEEVRSLVNARSTYGRGDELVVEDLLDVLPEDEESLAAFRTRALSTPIYTKSGLLSKDGRATTVQIEVAVYGAADSDLGDEGPEETDLDGFDEDFAGGFEDADDTDNTDNTDDASADVVDGDAGPRPFLSSRENVRLIEAIHTIVERYESPDFPVKAAGGTMLTYEFTSQLSRDVPLFFGGGLVVIGIILMVLFRRISTVLLCLSVVVPATIATFGLAAFFGIAFSAPAQLIPSFLLAIGVSYSVHLVTIFLHDLDTSGDAAASLEHAMRHSGLPILMTGLTTSAGFLSFLVAEMKPIQEMGMTSAIGVVVMLVYAMVLLPALLILLPLRGRARSGGGVVDRALLGLARLSIAHPRKIVAVTLLGVVFSILSMTRLHTSSDPVSWFPEDHDYAVASELLNEQFGGTSAIEVLLDTGRPDGLKEPEMLRKLEEIEALVANVQKDGAKVGNPVSLLDIAKETHQALNENDPAYYAVPADRILLAQELLLFENSGNDDLEKLVDSEFRRARFTVRSGWTNGVETMPFLARFKPAVQEIVGDAAHVEITGMSALISRTISAIYGSMMRSYGLAFLLITPLMILLIGSLRSGLISMVPNLSPIIFTLGMMGLVGIPLDMFTLLSGCIAIGLAVDDSIHFISGFRRCLAAGDDPETAVENTMLSTGRALLFTSVVLTSGFAVLLLSEMANLQNVGVLTVFAITAAFILDVTVTPALLVLTHSRRPAS
ncbi:MAG: RND family transporter [Myxococcota bacterium]